MEDTRKNKGIHILIGPKEKLPIELGRGGDLILIGNCTARWRGEGVFVKGCPPRFTEPIQTIIKKADYVPTHGIPVFKGERIGEYK